MSALNNPIFQDADLARKWLEGHLWTEGRTCGYCGTINNSTPIATRPGYYQCNNKACRKQFTVMVGTVFERSHIPLNKWLLASFLICSSKKGVSAHQIHRMLGLSYKTAWFMMHRIREAMANNSLPGPMGGGNKVVEADESYIGGKAKNRATREPAPKKAVPRSPGSPSRRSRSKDHFISTSSKIEIISACSGVKLDFEEESAPFITHLRSRTPGTRAFL